jgi:hypothetical protein
MGDPIFIIYVVVIMQNLHDVILATSQLLISARSAKHINISTRAKDVILKKHVTTNKSTVKYF